MLVTISLYARKKARAPAGVIDVFCICGAKIFICGDISGKIYSATSTYSDDKPSVSVPAL